MSDAPTDAAPRASAAATTHSPIGPQPMTSTDFPSRLPAIVTACSATDKGSASAAVVRSRPSGSTRSIDEGTTLYSAIPPWVCGVVDALPK